MERPSIQSTSINLNNMAIKPELLESAFNEEISKFEILLDEELKNKKIVKGDVVTLVVPNGLVRNHVPYLEKRYQSAGWTSVRYRAGDSSDQRVVNYIEFKY